MEDFLMRDNKTPSVGRQAADPEMLSPWQLSQLCCVPCPEEPPGNAVPQSLEAIVQESEQIITDHTEASVPFKHSKMATDRYWEKVW